MLYKIITPSYRRVIRFLDRYFPNYYTSILVVGDKFNP